MICKIKSCRESGRYFNNIYCRKHQRLIDLYGKPEYNPNWCGVKNGSFNNYGYWRITIDGKRILEHRYVMEKHIGRKIKKGEIVHHINGIRNDNRIKNLELISNHSKHMHYKHPHSKPCTDWSKYTIPKSNYLPDKRKNCIVERCKLTEKIRHLCRNHYISYWRSTKKTS